MSYPFERKFRAFRPRRFGREGGGRPPGIPLLLDNIDTSSLLHASSFRRLRTAYTGFCCQIERTSDNTTQDIAFVLDYVDTAAIASFCSGTTGRVRTFYDQGPGANDRQQTIHAGQPFIYDAGAVITRYGFVACREGRLGLAAFGTPTGVSGTSNFYVCSPVSVATQYICGEFGTLTGERTDWQWDSTTEQGAYHGNGNRKWNGLTDPTTDIFAYHHRYPQGGDHSGETLYEQNVLASVLSTASPTNQVRPAQWSAEPFRNFAGAGTSTDQYFHEMLLFGNTTQNPLTTAEEATIRADQVAYY